MVKKDMRETIKKELKMFTNFINGDNEQFVQQLSYELSAKDIKDGNTLPEGILFKKEEIVSIVRYLEYLIEFH